MAIKKKESTKSKKTTAKATKKVEGNTVSVATLCRELNVDPKKGRAKLRKAGKSAGDNRRYKDLIVGSKEYKEFVEIMS